MPTQAGYGAAPGYNPASAVRAAGNVGSVRRADFHAASVATLVFAPWSVFVFMCVTTAVCLAYSSIFVYLLFLAGLLAGIVLTFVNNKARGPMYKYLATLIIAATLAGFFIGKDISDTFMVQYWAPQLRPRYDNVNPVSPALAVADGGILGFADGARPDHEHALGLSVPLSGPRYCVAPIVGAEAGAEVNFWAGGKNCCGHRGEFVCGDATKEGVVTGMVYTDATEFTAKELAAFRKAVAQASAVYGLVAPANAVVVNWSQDMDDARWPYLLDTILLLMAWCALYLCISLGVAATLHWSNSLKKGSMMSLMFSQSGQP
eukprot:TRINITY_DN101957_c0_g1_i1.p1 TRINITY_DN101957_c0_g1~~TRINITY_DN101957_c0_g1_i1.p1  ORF type:complete len:318 (+),score=54.40 TRINITY_DN101957_c0_g1_i1:94-1047(+)